ncbi:MAG: tetratricopeptide repeat protein [Solobacterium sp.]|nr:tetratricopeptide repeat protein [Solobacterium sp.]
MKRILNSMLTVFLVTMLSGCACQHKPDASGAHVPVTLETAAGYLKDGEYGKAVETYSALIREDPADAACWLGRAQAYAASGTDQKDLEAAEADYRKVLELDNTITDAYTGLADVYVKMEDYESAAAVLTEGIAVFEDITGADAAGGLQMLEDKLADITFEEEKPADEGKTLIAGTVSGTDLSISSLSCAFLDGETSGNEGAVGMMEIRFNVEGPVNTDQVRIGGFGLIPDAQQYAEYMTAHWKEAEKESSSQQPRTVPFEETNAFPVREDDFGKTVPVLLVGLDADMDMVGYMVVDIPVAR